MKIAVFGLGYVGAVSCGCLPQLGHEVVGIDVNEDKVKRIAAGQPPVLEVGLPELVQEAVASGRLRSTTDAAEAVRETDAALVCVGTPSTRSGGVNSVYLEKVAEQIGEALRDDPRPFYAVLNRSTSLVPIHRRLAEILERASGRKLGEGVGYACHPEFLREGVAVEDFHSPPKIVFGPTDRKTQAVCDALYPGIDVPTFNVSMEQAAMIKYADNCFHALKVTFANEIGMICGELGVDARAVMEVFCQDTKLNISPKYFRPGAPFGGSCLPKDVRAMLDTARDLANPLPMLSGVLKSNTLQIERLMRRIVSAERPTVGIVGLAFKENTDDVRESPMVALVEQVSGKGHPVRLYDAHLATERMTGANRSFALMSIPHLAELLTHDLQAVVDEADILVISHKLSPEAWQAVRFREGQRILDLVGIESLADKPGYEGLYW